jgi:iron complex transport system permease protein
VSGWRPWLALAVALVGASVLALAMGAVNVPSGDLIGALAGTADAQSIAIVRDIRLPRLMLGALVGAGLSVSGVALQGTLRNPLAEPYLLGVSGGAAVGAVLATALGVTQPGAVALAAFVGAGLAAILSLGIARAAGAGMSSPVLVMAGVVVGAFANAAIIVVLSGATSGEVRDALWWMMGSLGGATWGAVGRLAVFVIVAGAALWIRARDVDVLSLGPDAAAALTVFLAAAMLAAATVASAGLIGFVGLVVPAIVRALGARGTRSGIVAAALGGAALVVAADVVARTVRAPAELPLGAVTALVGVPFFLARMRHAS